MLRSRLACHLAAWGEAYDRGMAEVARLGYQACELGSRCLFAMQKEPEKLRELLAQHGLSAAAVFEFGHFENRVRRREVLLHHDQLARLMEQVGVNLVVLSPGTLRKRSGPTVEDLQHMTEVIAQIVRRYGERGVRVAVHPHIGTSIFTMQEIDYIMASGPPELALVPDLWHCAEAGVDVSRLIAEYSSRIASIHLRDARQVKHDGRRRLRTEPCDLGEGELALGQLFQAIRTYGYGGWLTVETERPLTTPAESAAANLQYLLSAFVKS